MADVPDTIVLKRNRDLEGMFVGAIWLRRTILALIAAGCALGLANVFGQRSKIVTAAAPAATLKLDAPSRLRGGDLFSARFHIQARRELRKATLVLDPGWAEGMAINTIEPSPIGEASANGRLSFDLGHVPAGQAYVLYMQFQVNPTNVAWRRPAGVELDDGPTRILRVDRRITIFP